MLIAGFLAVLVLLLVSVLLGRYFSTLAKGLAWLPIERLRRWLRTNAGRIAEVDQGLVRVYRAPAGRLIDKGKACRHAESEQPRFSSPAVDQSARPGATFLAGFAMAIVLLSPLHAGAQPTITKKLELDPNRLEVGAVPILMGDTDLGVASSTGSFAGEDR